MKMTQKRQTLFLILGIYLIAIALAIITFLMIDFQSIVIDIMIANLAATLFIFLMGLYLKNSSLYDPYWSVIPPVITISLSILWGRFWDLNILLLNVALVIWAMRLTYNWARLWKDFNHQDWRYTMIKNKFPKIWFLSNLFGIHVFPTLIVFIQLIGAIYYIRFSNEISLLSYVGFMMIVIATFIQFKADQQMYHFKKTNKTDIMNSGLWQYSRHPNYFGEILVWMGVYVFYLSAVQTLDLQLLAPILMLLMFVFISIPMLENKMVSSKPAYKSYQEQVSMLIFLPPKKETMKDKMKEST
jgi:steroid 5-alpha reductase family enzyme